MKGFVEVEMKDLQPDACPTCGGGGGNDPSGERGEDPNCQDCGGSGKRLFKDAAECVSWLRREIEWDGETSPIWCRDTIAVIERLKSEALRLDEEHRHLREALVNAMADVRVGLATITSLKRTLAAIDHWAEKRPMQIP